MSIQIPDSLEKYFAEELIKESVNYLLGQLDGKKYPSKDLAEARNYNKALQLAAQTRYEYIELLYQIWEEVFECENKLAKFKKPAYSPYETWEQGYISAETETGNFEFYLYLNNDELQLQAYKPNPNGKRPYSSLKNSDLPSGWSHKNDEDNYDFLSYQCPSLKDEVQWDEFHKHPQPAIDELKKAVFDFKTKYEL